MTYHNSKVKFCCVLVLSLLTPATLGNSQPEIGLTLKPILHPT